MKTVVCLAAAMLLSACALRPEPSLQVAVSEVRLLPRGEGAVVDVSLANSGRKPTERVTVSCNYLDAAGAPVGSGLVYFNKVGAGGSDRISQMVVVPGVARGDCAVRKPVR